MAYESLHSMHNMRSGKKGSLALKLDISKAYDWVEWYTLKGIMSKLGLPDMCVERVMSCVTTSSFSVQINGKAYGNIRPSRGLHQGDPLFPYLFLLCAKGFSSLLAKAQEEGRLHGVSICWRAPTISHLLFTDDSLLFCKVNQKRYRLLQRFYKYMQLLQANASTLRNPQFILVATQQGNRGITLTWLRSGGGGQV